MKKIYSWLIDKWLAGFLTASLFFLLKLYIDLPKDSKIHFFEFEWFIEIISIKIPLYSLFIVIIFLIFITRFEKSRLKQNYTSKQSKAIPTTPYNHYGNYKTDIFGRNKSKWSWDYKWRQLEQSFEIIDLKPNCPNCGTRMDLETGYTYQLAGCHKCRLEGKQYNFDIKEIIYDVEKEIIRKINNKEVPV